jgi:hypothetical protein
MKYCQRTTVIQDLCTSLGRSPQYSLVDASPVRMHAPLQHSTGRPQAIRFVTRVLEEQCHNTVRRNSMRREVANYSAVVCMRPKILDSQSNLEGRGHTQLAW